MTPAAARASARSVPARKIGDSSTCSRTHSPTMTSTADSRNGIRQPQARNAASLWKTARKASRPLAISWPAGAPACGHEAQKPRLRGLPCSETMSTAPPHSPPRAKPWMQRSTVSSTGASTPTCAWLGSSPIANVATPIISSETMSSFLRPSLSPKWPNTRPPSGRKTKPIQYVANDSSVACSGSEALGKNTCGKTSRRGDAVQEEVVPLDGGADEARGDDAGDG